MRYAIVDLILVTFTDATIYAQAHFHRKETAFTRLCYYFYNRTLIELSRTTASCASPAELSNIYGS